MEMLSSLIVPTFGGGKSPQVATSIYRSGHMKVAEDHESMGSIVVNADAELHEAPQWKMCATRESPGFDESVSTVQNHSELVCVRSVETQTTDLGAQYLQRSIALEELDEDIHRATAEKRALELEVEALAAQTVAMRPGSGSHSNNGVQRELADMREEMKLQRAMMISLSEQLKVIGSVVQQLAGPQSPMRGLKV